MEIHPCVLQDIGPLGPLPKKAKLRPGRASWRAWRAKIRPGEPIMSPDGQQGGDVRTDGRMDGRLAIHPCVLQDIGPLGPLPKKANQALGQ